MAWDTTQPSLLERMGNPDDHDAWRRFDARYGSLIVRYGCRRGLELADAEDVRQIVLLNLVRAFRTFRYQPERGRFRSYLGRVVGNAIHRYRNRPHRSREVLELSGELLTSRAAPDDRDEVWEEEWVDHHLRLALRTVERTFDPRSVEAFERLLAGESTADVAHALGLSVDAVHKVRQRVRERLRAVVADQVREEDGWA